MKLLIVSLLVTFSVNSFANELTRGTDMVSFILTSITSTGMRPYGKAQAVIRDANEYHLNGVATPYLAEQIKNLQSENDVSDDEAVDLLVEAAQEILSSNY